MIKIKSNSFFVLIGTLAVVSVYAGEHGSIRNLHKRGAIGDLHTHEATGASQDTRATSPKKNPGYSAKFTADISWRKEIFHPGNLFATITTVQKIAEE